MGSRHGGSHQLAPKHRMLPRMPIDAVKTARLAAPVTDICSHTAQSSRISSRTHTPTTADVALLKESICCEQHHVLSSQKFKMTSLFHRWNMLC